MIAVVFVGRGRLRLSMPTMGTRGRHVCCTSNAATSSKTKDTNTAVIRHEKPWSVWVFNLEETETARRLFNRCK